MAIVAGGTFRFNTLNFLIFFNQATHAVEILTSSMEGIRKRLDFDNKLLQIQVSVMLYLKSIDSLGDHKYMHVN